MHPLFMAAVIATLLVTSAALADVAPDPDSLGAHCTLEEQCQNGTFCSYENNADDPAVHEKTKACEAGAKAKGLEYRCTDGGGTVGQTLYCPKGETGSWDRSGCSRCAVAASSSPAELLSPLLLMLGLAVSLTRRATRAVLR